jgi:circadian clock protein KaiC
MCEVDRAEIEETGEYDLEGLFIRLIHAIESIGAKRVSSTPSNHFSAALKTRQFFVPKFEGCFNGLGTKESRR